MRSRVLTLVFILSGFGYILLLKVLEPKKFFMALTSSFIIILIISGGFQIFRPNWFSEEDPYNKRYMTNNDYDIAIYMKYHPYPNVITNDGLWHESFLLNYWPEGEKSG